MKRLTKKIKEMLIEMVGHRCEECQTKENLEIHRIIRGNKGGEYIPRNIKILCRKCHKKYHELEFK